MLHIAPVCDWMTWVSQGSRPGHPGARSANPGLFLRESSIARLQWVRIMITERTELRRRRRPQTAAGEPGRVPHGTYQNVERLSEVREPGRSRTGWRLSVGNASQAPAARFRDRVFRTHTEPRPELHRGPDEPGRPV